MPGPACYGRGGTAATVTDAAAVLGYLDPGFFLGGRMQLDLPAAELALRQIAEQLGQSMEAAAAGILAIANEHMVKAIQEITVNQGYDPRDCTIVAGGGSSGLGIMQIAAKLGCRTVLLPRTAAALSACGAQYSDIAFEQTGSCVTRTDDFDLARVNATLAEIDAGIDTFARKVRERGVADVTIT